MEGIVSSVTPRCVLAFFLAAAPLAASATDLGMVEGRVVLSPAAPVQRMGELNERPFKGHFAIVNDQGAVVAQVESDNHGAFRVALRPGRYTIRRDPASVIGKVEKGAFVVRAGEITKMLVIYDAGIR